MKIKKLSKVTTTNISNESEYTPIVFVNNPITDRDHDVIGFNTQVDTLQCAIDDGATMIGIIADYGTGKSSLTELLCKSDVQNKKKKPIRINLWDCLTQEKGIETGESVSSLTKSFLFQLASGSDRKFSSYVNKRLSKNFGNISFEASDFRAFFKHAAMAGILFALHLIASIRETGIMQYLPDCLDIVAAFFKQLSPLFVIASIAVLLLGFKDLSIAFSHWNMTDKREMEINDVFDVYRLISEKIIPKDEKRLVIIDDLDRIDKREIVVTFLKELYRFRDSIIEYRENLIFIVSIKPESELEPKKESSVYSKIFDEMLFLRPIHFDDYDSILLRMIKSEPEKQKHLEKLIDESIGDTLPSSFKWIKTGTNLTLRELKDRLNHAIAIMVSLKNKSHKGNSAAKFSPCAAVAYLERQFPNDYYRLIKDEESFANFMKHSHKIVNDGLFKDDMSTLKASFQREIKGSYSQNFVDAFCSMVFDGIFDDDFRMYFYTYPKDSHIKTTEEREICNCLLFPYQHGYTSALDASIERAYRHGNNKAVAEVLRTLDAFPLVVIENDTLFKHAASISIQKVFDVFSRNIISESDAKHERETYWRRIKCLDTTQQSEFKKLCIAKIRNMAREETIIRIRTDIIKGYRHDISEFSDLFVSSGNLPQITNSEIQLINDPLVSIPLINLETIKKSQQEYLCEVINTKPTVGYVDVIDKAILVLKKLIELCKAQEIGKAILAFLENNKLCNEELFCVVCNASLPKEKIAQYLSWFNPNEIPQGYWELIDSLGFEEYLKGELVCELARNGLLFTPILYYAKTNQLQKLDAFLNNDCAILPICEKVNKINEQLLIAFRRHRVINRDDSTMTPLYFGTYPLITKEEYGAFSDTRHAINHINTHVIKVSDIPRLAEIIYSRKYKSEETVYLFSYLFCSDINKSCITDRTIAKELIEKLDFSRFDTRNLSLNQRSQVYLAFSKLYAPSNSTTAINFSRHFGCFIPEIEKIISNDRSAKSKYMDLIVELDELSDSALIWLESNPVTIPLSEKLCHRLIETERYRDAIVADVLRRNRLDIDDRIDISEYISVYAKIDSVFEIMSSNSSFLGRVQDKATFSDLGEKRLIPLFAMQQSGRFINFILSDKVNTTLKTQYLKEFGDFRTEYDAVAFQKMICKPENIKLIDSLILKERIAQQLGKASRGARLIFTRTWNQEWADKFSTAQPV